MPEIDKHLLRLASAVHAGLAAHGGRDRFVELPSGSWDSCAELVRQSQRAELRGWHLAAEELRRDLGYTLPTLQAELNALVSQLPRIMTTKTMATIGDIYADLLALQRDFVDVEYDVRDRWLRVTTEPITLEGIYLGPFEIRLEWQRVGNDSAYRVIAQDPHPCESRENVTHPHVMDERLCEGDSRYAIRQAVAQGRLLDFFTLVANGLRSYNPDSPFVELALWHGGSCSDCGAAVDEDEGYVCQKCDCTICSGCEYVCTGCEDSCCSECMTGCHICDENYCRSCLRECTECHERVCVDCLPKRDVAAADSLGKYLARPVLQYAIGSVVHPYMLSDFRNQGVQTVSIHDERCVNCHENERKRIEENTQTAHGAPIQPHGVGQALVSA